MVMGAAPPIESPLRVNKSQPQPAGGGWVRHRVPPGALGTDTWSTLPQRPVHGWTVGRLPWRRCGILEDAWTRLTPHSCRGAPRCRDPSTNHSGGAGRLAQMSPLGAHTGRSGHDQTRPSYLSPIGRSDADTQPGLQSISGYMRPSYCC